MKKTQRLSHIEEIELCKLAQSNDSSAREMMVRGNLGLVGKVVRKLYHKNEQYSYEDMFQEGVIGLLKAIDKFDATQGCRFSTYSYYWIYCYAGRCHTNQIGKIRIPSHLKEKLRKYEKEGDIRFQDVKDSIPRVMSLNSLIGENTTLEDIVTVEDNSNEQQDMSDFRSEIKSLLTEREYEIICHRYGMENQEAKTQRECAKIYNVSYATIFNIEKKAIKKLKEAMKN